MGFLVGVSLSKLRYFESVCVYANFVIHKVTYIIWPNLFE